MPMVVAVLFGLQCHWHRSPL